MGKTTYVSVSSGDVLSYLSETETYMNENCDVEDIIRAISAPTVSTHFRIFVLYNDETINYEIPIEDIMLGGSVDESYQNGQRRNLNFTLYNESGKYTPNINTLWAGTRLRVDVGLSISSTTTIWFPKGIFVVKTLSPSHSSQSSLVSVSAADKFSLFEANTGTLDTSYEVPVNSEIEQVINDILLFENGNGEPFDSKPIIYHTSFSGKKTQATISKSQGDTFASILLELATQLSAEIFYNSQGNLVLIPLDEVSQDDQKSILYHFSAEQGDFNSLNFSFDLGSVINRVIVVGATNTTGVHTATAVNDNPSSPLCYQRIGYRTGSIINDNNITTDYLAQERANYELRKQLILKSSVTLQIIFNPLLEVNNLITITDEFYNIVGEKFLIQSISFPLDYSGVMSISVTNISNLSFI